MGHHQSDEHRIRFKDRAGETSGRQDGALMGFSERVRTVLNWTTLAYLFFLDTSIIISEDMCKSAFIIIVVLSISIYYYSSIK